MTQIVHPRLQRDLRQERPSARDAMPTPSRMARLVRSLTVANVIAIAGVWVLLHVVSERWWLSSALTYLPRFPYLLGVLVLLPCAWRWHRPSVWWSLAAAAVVLGPIAGLQFPSPWREPTGPAPFQLRIVSCNVQGFEPDFPAVLQEIWPLDPDVVAFQEAYNVPRRLKRAFAGWHCVRASQFWIGSRYPIRRVSECDCPESGRTTALKVEIQSPAGPFLLTNLHLSTARHSLAELRPATVLDGSGPDCVTQALAVRANEAALTRAYFSEGDSTLPALAVGDFNTPATSSLYRAYWSDLTNAFDAAGCGFGYTGSCRRHDFWPANLPWVRIDHILATSHWNVLECRVGRHNGSDHRLVFAVVGLGPR